MEKLLALATHLDTTDKVYNQRMYQFCAMGHYFEFVAPELNGQYLSAVVQIAIVPNALPPMVLAEFGITEEQAHELFDADGCGGAGTCPKAAAAYIREFVARNAPVALPLAA